MPFAKADFSIDAVRRRWKSTGRGKRSRQGRTAIGIASAPISIRRIGVWIKTLESHGIMLVRDSGNAEIKSG
jgi:hypothetical protein